jgi:hypothetical protein
VTTISRQVKRSETLRARLNRMDLCAKLEQHATSCRALLVGGELC